MMESSNNVSGTTTTAKLPTCPFGIWNPEIADDPDKGRNSFGINPNLIRGAGSEATIGWNLDLWSLIVEDGAKKGRFNVTIQDTMGSGSSGNFMVCKNALVSLDFDSDIRPLYYFDGKLNNWLGNLVGRLVLNGQYFYDVESRSQSFQTSMSSLALGLEEPFHLGSFSMIKRLGYTLTCSGGSSSIGGDYSGNSYGKFEMELKMARADEYADIYIKNKFGTDMYNRAGLTLRFKRGTVSAEIYNNDRNTDFDLSGTLRLKRIESKNGKNTVDITGRVFANEWVSWLNSGYDRPIFGGMIAIEASTPNWKIFSVLNGQIDNNKSSPSVDDETKSYTPASRTWKGGDLSVASAGGSRPNVFQFTIEGAPDTVKNINAGNWPRLVLNAPSTVNYKKRSLIVGNTGEAALPTEWEDGGASPLRLYIKSVKILDKINNKRYCLNAAGQIVELTGPQPETPPDLTGARMYFTGKEQEFKLPSVIWSNEIADRRIQLTAEVEYGADVSGVDPNALKRYSTGGDPRLIFDPNWGVMDVYNKSVRWAGYHDDDPDRILFDKYDPTQAHDPSKKNEYNAGLKNVQDFDVEASLVY